MRVLSKGSELMGLQCCRAYDILALLSSFTDGYGIVLKGDVMATGVVKTTADSISMYQTFQQEFQ